MYDRDIQSLSSFYVDFFGMNLARATVADYGGSVMEGEWGNPIFKVCNICDPEGNHIQIRGFRP